MAGRLHRGQAGLDAFADHEHFSRVGEPYGSAATRAKHHLLRLDRRLSGTVAGEKCAMDGKRRVVGAAGYEGDHRWPEAAREMLQPAMEAERCRCRDVQPARREVGLGEGSLCWHRGLPDCDRGRALRAAAIRLALALVPQRGARGQERSVLRPQTARSECADDALLSAARVTAHQHLAVDVADRQTWFAIIMRRTARYPCCPCAVPAECLG